MAVFVSVWDGGDVEFESECEVAPVADGVWRVTSMGPAAAVDSDGERTDDPDEVDGWMNEVSHLDEEYVEFGGRRHTALPGRDYGPSEAAEADGYGNGVVLY